LALFNRRHNTEQNDSQQIELSLLLVLKSMFVCSSAEYIGIILQPSPHNRLENKTFDNLSYKKQGTQRFFSLKLLL